jgi:hypothetical protein
MNGVEKIKTLQKNGSLSTEPFIIMKGHVKTQLANESVTYKMKGNFL